MKEQTLNPISAFDVGDSHDAKFWSSAQPQGPMIGVLFSWVTLNSMARTDPRPFTRLPWPEVENGLTNEPIADSGRNGRARRRSFTDEEKLAIVLECEQPGDRVSAVVRVHRLPRAHLFRWRADLGYGRNASAGKTRADPATLVLRDLLPVPEGMTAIDLPDWRRVPDAGF